MSARHAIGSNTYYVKCNNVPRELVSWYELPLDGAREGFDYAYLSDDSDEIYQPRFFKYRGSWYDSHEFARADSDTMAMGFNAIQTESYYSAVAIRYFDKEGYEYDGAVVVGYIHW